MRSRPPPSQNPVSDEGLPSGGYLLRLYIAGATPRSSRAVVNLRKICETHLQGRYEIEVVDLMDNPDRAREDQIIAAPTLIRRLPLPERRFIGDLSQTGRVLTALDASAASPSL